MSYMFYKSDSLKYLPDISYWDTKYVVNMNNMFSYCNSMTSCESLRSLPDISKWNTKNVKNMSYMFMDFSSLESLPDISKWDFNNEVIMNHMFDGCNSLKSLPNIYKGRYSKIKQKTIIYKTPDKYYDKKIKLFGEEFVNNNKDNCSLFIEGKKQKLCSEIIVDYEQCKYKELEIRIIENKPIINMSYMFCNCNSLLSLPDLSYWDVKNVTNMSFMFSGCSLKSFPDLSKWKLNKNLKTTNIFQGLSEEIIPKKFKHCLIF